MVSSVALHVCFILSPSDRHSFFFDKRLWILHKRKKTERPAYFDLCTVTSFLIAKDVKVVKMSSRLIKWIEKTL